MGVCCSGQTSMNPGNRLASMFRNAKEFRGPGRDRTRDGRRRACSRESERGRNALLATALLGFDPGPAAPGTALTARRVSPSYPR